MSRDLRVLSLGAGVQSSALALMMTAGEVPSADFAVFADTQDEPLSVYRWLEWLTPRLSFPVHVRTAGKLSDRALQIHTSRVRVAKESGEATLFGPEPEQLIGGRTYLKGGIPVWTSTGPMPRHCTRDGKIDVILQCIREEMAKVGAKHVVQVMGISVDEATRTRQAQHDYLTNDYPLVDMKVTRHDCLDWMAARGYPKPPRSACVFCPYHDAREWARLKREEPDEFARAVSFESRLQAAAAQVTIRSTLWLHESCRPIGEIDFGPLVEKQEAEDRAQGRLFSEQRAFNNECEGLCGV